MKTMAATMLTVVLAGCASAPKVDNSVVAAFDLNRYLGDWYEIARFDHRFERGIEETKATYSLREDGKVDVLNSGVKNGKPSTAKGVGKTTKTPGLLRVTFFWPFYADYRIIELAPDYSYAVVTAGSRDYFWVLSRKPTMPKEQLDGILGRAKAWGFDLTELEYPSQSPGGK